MKKELEDKLFEKYPKLYEGRNLGMRHNLMCFGFECGDGWYTIIDELSSKITKEDPSAMAVQVKEKFGGLRFYMGAYTDKVYDYTGEAEKLSYKTCEKCGSTENVAQTKGGWIKTLCVSCMGEK